MRVIFLLLSFLLILAILDNCVYADQANSGSTVIDASVSGLNIINLSLQAPEIFIPEDYYFYENLTVFQINSEDASVYLNKTDGNNFVKFVNKTGGGEYYQDDYTLFPPLNTFGNVTLRVYVPPNQGFNGGTYNIPIYAYSLGDSRWNTTTLKVRVNNTNPIDDIEILNINPSSLYPGESLGTNVSIHKIQPAEMTDIQICYCINTDPNYLCGPLYNNYGCSWKAITDWLNYTKTVTVNEDPGDYYFIVAVKYPGDENIKRANSPVFHVLSTPSQPPSGRPGGGVPSGGGPAQAAQPQLNIISLNYLEASPGEEVRFEVEVENIGEVNAPDTTLNVYGIPEKWISVVPSQPQDVGAGESKNYSVLISLPSDAFEQVYSLSLVAKSGTIETTRTVTLTVARLPKDRAKFLLREASGKKNEAEKIIAKAKGFGMDTAEPENLIVPADSLYSEAKELFKSLDYGGTIEKAKQAIEGYRSVIESTKDVVEKAYLVLLSEVRYELAGIEGLTEERNVIDSIKDKINQSIILQKQRRVIGAYEKLLDAKQVLEQLKDKIRLGQLAYNVAIIAGVIVIIIVITFLFFYRKMALHLLRTVAIEEQKRRLRHLFKREVRPTIKYKRIHLRKEKTIPRKERKWTEKRPKEVRQLVPLHKERREINEEKLNEISRLLKKGAELAETDISGAKDAFIKVKKIYNSLSPGERKIIDNEVAKITELRNKIVRKSREKGE